MVIIYNLPVNNLDVDSSGFAQQHHGSIIIATLTPVIL